MFVGKAALKQMGSLPGPVHSGLSGLLLWHGFQITTCMPHILLLVHLVHSPLQHSIDEYPFRRGNDKFCAQ